MPYPGEHALVTIGGTIGNGEIWQIGVRAEPVGVVAQPWDEWLDQVGIEDCWADVVTWMTATGVGPFPAAWRARWIKIAALNAEGHYLLDAKYYSASGTGAQGAGTVGMPFQSACAITLDSGRKIGKGNTNRFYAPPLAVNVDSGSGVWPTGECTALLTRTKTMLQAIEGELSTVGRAMAIRVLGQTGSGTSYPVAQLRVGRVPDTQRRRRNALAEDYQVASW